MTYMRVTPGMRTVAGSILTSDNIFSWRFGHEIIYTTILSLPLIQVGQSSGTGEIMSWLTP